MVLATCCALGWFLWGLMDHPFLGYTGEHSHYMELARSMAEGHGYTLTHGGTRVPYLDSPPLYPFVLSLLMNILDETHLPALVHPFKLFNLGLYIVSVFLTYSFVNRQIRKPYPYIITALYALSPMTLAVADSITSEMLYVVFSLLALVAVDKYYAEQGAGVSRWQLLWCGLCLVACILTRNIGFALLVGFFLLSLKTLGIKRACVVSVLVLVCLSPWFIREIYYRNAEAVQTSQGQALQSPPEALPVTQIFDDPVEFAEQAFKNGESNLIDATQHTLGALDFERFDGVLVKKLHVENLELRFSDYAWVRWTIGALIALGILIGFYQGAGIGSCYLMVFILVAAVLSVDKQRFLMPVLPLMLFYLFFGVMRIGEWMAQLKMPVSKIAVPLLTLLIGINSFSGHLENLREARLIQAYNRPESLEETQQGLVRALRWIHLNTPPSAEIVAHKPTATFVYTDRKSRRFPHQRKSKTLMKDLMRSDYVLEEEGVGSVRSYLTPVIEKYQKLFRLVYNDPDSQIRIWKVQATAP